MGLSEFLLARIAEDEADASDVHELDCDLVRNGVVDPTFGWRCTCGRPARVLAECDAKRRIVARKPRLSARDDVRDVWWDLVALLALPHADHPDYRQEWRP